MVSSVASGSSGWCTDDIGITLVVLCATGWALLIIFLVITVVERRLRMKRGRGRMGPSGLTKGGAVTVPTVTTQPPNTTASRESSARVPVSVPVSTMNSNPIAKLRRITTVTKRRKESKIVDRTRPNSASAASVDYPDADYHVCAFKDLQINEPIGKKEEERRRKKNDHMRLAAFSLGGEVGGSPHMKHHWPLLLPSLCSPNPATTRQPGPTTTVQVADMAEVAAAGSHSYDMLQWLSKIKWRR